MSNVEIRMIYKNKYNKRVNKNSKIKVNVNNRDQKKIEIKK